MVLPGVARAADTAGGAGRVDSGAYTSAEGTYDWLAYVPVGWKRGERWPLYVMLHGCDTTPDQQMHANAMNPIADREHVILLYADTFYPGRAAGSTGECWRASSGADLSSEVRGGGGDADAIAAMTRAVMARYTVDSERVYLMGMSAGSFQTTDTGAAYPDLFAAIGVQSGGGYGMGVGCAGMTDDVVPFFAQLAVTEMGARARPMPFFSIGGTADPLGEAPAPGGCARLAFEQWMASDNILLTGKPDGTAFAQDSSSTQKGTVPGGYPWTHYVWRDQDGCPIGERWVVDGMGHYWSGGSSDPTWAQWTDRKGPSAAEASLRFFEQFTLSNGNVSCGQAAAPATAQAPDQAPAPAPAAAPAEPPAPGQAAAPASAAASSRLACPARWLVVRVPRGARAVRAAVGGRRTSVRLVAGRARVRLPATISARRVVVVRGRTRTGTNFMRRHVDRSCT